MLIAMNRKVQHTKNVTINQKYHQQDILLVALVEHLLRPLAVVDVDIHDHHSLGETLLDAMFGCYRHVVEKAIAVVFVLHGVVTWRSHECHPVLHVSLGHGRHEVQNGRQRTTSGVESKLKIFILITVHANYALTLLK
jgi:hypothetical protein